MSTNSNIKNLSCANCGKIYKSTKPFENHVEKCTYEKSTVRLEYEELVAIIKDIEEQFNYDIKLKNILINHMLNKFKKNQKPKLIKRNVKIPK